MTTRPIQRRPNPRTPDLSGVNQRVQDAVNPEFGHRARRPMFDVRRGGRAGGDFRINDATYGWYWLQDVT